MEIFKGTKGKWEYKVISTKNQTKITVQIPGSDYKSKTELILGYLDREDDCNVASCCKTTEHANAKLISLAPEMLEMLIRMEKSNDWQIEDYFDLKELIKKATDV